MIEVIVTPCARADLDGAACAIAYAEFLRRSGRRAAALLAEAPDAEARFVLERAGHPPMADIREAAGATEIVLVDASDVLGLPSFVDPGRVVEVIDHRSHHDTARLFPKVHLQIETVGAAATLVAERIWRAGLEPSRASTLLLFGAIQSNTQRLRGTVTTERDVRASRRLEGMGHIPDNLIEGQFAARAAEILADLPAAVAREKKTFEHPTGPYVISQIELPGATKLVAHELSRLLDHLPQIHPRAMLNVVDVERACSIMIVPDAALRRLVAARMRLSFEGAVAVTSVAVLRKQIVAWLHATP